MNSEISMALVASGCSAFSSSSVKRMYCPLACS